MQPTVVEDEFVIKMQYINEKNGSKKYVFVTSLLLLCRLLV